MNTMTARISMMLLACSLVACRARQADEAELAALEAATQTATDEGSASAEAPDAGASDTTSVATTVRDVGIATSDVVLRLSPVEGSGVQLRAVQTLRRPNLQPQNIRINSRVPAESRIAPSLTPLRPVQTRSGTTTGDQILLAPSATTTSP